MKPKMNWLLHLLIFALCVKCMKAQMGGDMAEIAANSVSCPDLGGFTGDPAYVGKGPQKAPLLGTIGCIDEPPQEFLAGKLQYVSLIYGPFEAGFSNTQLKNKFGCNSDTFELPSGIDTALAELVAEHECGLNPGDVKILKDCGMHADPAHAHEDMSCLYKDSRNGHSTRVGVALDGHGIYGKYIRNGVVPTDLDACNGRWGVTPDSNGETVYYYVITDRPPFTVGCFGPVASLQECRDLYPGTCGDDESDLNFATGTKKYDLRCPCFDSTGSNVISNVSPSPSPTPVSPSPTPSDGAVVCQNDSDCGTDEYCDQNNLCQLPPSPSPSCGGPCCCGASQYCSSNICVDVTGFDYIPESLAPFPLPYEDFSVIMISDIQFWYIVCKDEPFDECIYNIHPGNRVNVMEDAVDRHVNCINNLPGKFDLLIDGGDLTNIGDVNELARYETFLDALPKIPKALVLGNHDYYEPEIPSAADSARMITYLNTSLNALQSESTISFLSADFGYITVNVGGVNTLFVKGSLMYSFEVKGIIFIAMHWAPALKGARYIHSFSAGTANCPGTNCETISGDPEYYEMTDGYDWLFTQLSNAQTSGKKVILVPHFIDALGKYLDRNAASAIRGVMESACIGVLTGHDHDQWGFWGKLRVGSQTIDSSLDVELDKNGLTGGLTGIDVYYAGSVTYEKFITVHITYNSGVPTLSVEQYTTDSVNGCAPTGSNSDTVSSPSPSASISVSISPSISPSLSSSPSISPSSSLSIKPSVSASVTPPASVSATASVSSSASMTPPSSISATASASSSASMTPPSSVSATASVSSSASMTPPASISATASFSSIASVTPSISSSETPIASSSASMTPSVSVSAAASISASTSLTPSVSSSETPIASSSTSMTPSTSISASTSIAPSTSYSETPSVSSSNNPDPSPSTSSGMSESPSISATFTVTPSVSFSPSSSLTTSVTPSLISTTSPTESSSSIVLATPSTSTTSGISVSPTGSEGASNSPNPSNTASMSTSASPEATPSSYNSAKPKASKSSTPIPSVSRTPSASPSVSPTSSSSPSPSVSVTPSPSTSVTPSMTPSPSPKTMQDLVQDCASALQGTNYGRALRTCRRSIRSLQNGNFVGFGRFGRLGQRPRGP